MTHRATLNGCAFEVASLAPEVEFPQPAQLLTRARACVHASVGACV